jgi:hypothetical protein
LQAGNHIRYFFLSDFFDILSGLTAFPAILFTMRMRRFVLFAMVLCLALPAMPATVAHSSLRHRGAQRHPVHRVQRHAVSAHHRSLQRRHTRLREVRSSRRVGPVRRAVRVSASRTGRSRWFTRIHFVSPLRGSLASLVRQNVRDDAEGLVRIQDQAQLLDLESAGDLVPIPVSKALLVNPSLPPERRYCRPWTALFLDALARSHYARFHRPIEIDSAVRTVSFQRHLQRINGNAAPAEGDVASPHLTGAAIDIGKKRMSFSEISWMRGWLLPLQTSGKLDVEEEFHQACFHIDVYRSYDRAPAASHPAAASLIAAGVN